MKENKPFLIIIAGPNGSGKTSITQQILQHDWLRNSVYINPDEIAKQDFGDWNNPDFVLKAAQKADVLRYQSLEKRENIIFETVFSAQEKIDFVKKAKASDYFIRLFFVCTESPLINASRITQRVMTGGHEVPISKIISRYSKSINNCMYISNLVDRLYIYDNSIDFQDPQLIFRANFGKLIRQYQKTPTWAIPIFQELDSRP